ncbi:hypothetical protein O181_034202 [Austropuccinia psidii MF-1]|uniref:DUF221-domain-containing protein n=1 Tax=Austropuccinia psidii MF-1 TaxID=1389203 RepID=A0A9Q3H7V4_9BASI|nr:hypothetical protein [Austropuccinia psidii MF-1]
MSASRDDVKSTTNQTFLTALVLNSAIAAAQILGFIIIRSYFRKVYQPRSYLPSPQKRSDALSSGFFSWIPQIIMADEDQIIYNNGLDAYCFLRFLKLVIYIFAPIFTITWSILLPVYSVHSTGDKSGLDQFTFGNIGQTAQSRLAAPLVLTYCFTFYVLYLLKQEIERFIKKRQSWLTSDVYRATAQSRTVLVTGIPNDLLSTKALDQLTSHLHLGARRIWIVRDLKDLPEIYERQTVAFSKLESGYAKLMNVAYKNLQKNQKSKDLSSLNLEDGHDNSKFLSRSQRPTHKLGLLGIFGKKVDTIDWATQELLETKETLDSRRRNMADYATQSSAFIEFNTQIAAHLFAQSSIHHLPLKMTGRWTDVASADVIWSSLNLNPLEQRLRALISWAITIALIVFWSIPVAFVGLISNVNSLCVKVSWMAWLCKLPSPVNGIIQGVLPPVMLALLFMLLPPFLRFLAVFQGIPLGSLVELSLMNRYFLFLVIHGFLVVTLSAGLVAAIPQIVQQPESAVIILAQELPKASTFFLTYIVTTCLAGAAGSILQIGGLVIYNLKLRFLASTPRAVYQTRHGMSTVAWGTLFPNMTLLAVIGLSYCVVSPIMNGFVLFGFALIWFVYKYLFIFVMDLPAASETGGKFFPIAIRQMFVGLYIGQVFICALFFFSQDAQGRQSGVVEGALMIALIIMTTLFQSLVTKDFFPLVDYLPMSLVPSDQLPSEVEEIDSTKSADPIIQKEHVEDRYTPDKQHEFDHPAQWKNIGVVWIADDQVLNIGQNAAQELRKVGIYASTSGAKFDTDAKKVIVTKNPPDELQVIEIPPED